MCLVYTVEKHISSVLFYSVLSCLINILFGYMPCFVVCCSDMFHSNSVLLPSDLSNSILFSSDLPFLLCSVPFYSVVRFLLCFFVLIMSCVLIFYSISFYSLMICHVLFCSGLICSILIYFTHFCSIIKWNYGTKQIHHNLMASIFLNSALFRSSSWF